MLHGLGCASSFEYPHVANAPALAGRHVILLDLFGSGYSDQPADFGYRVGDHAKAVAEFVEHLKFERMDLYGHSMGGTIAIEAATILGKTVRNLVLSEANLDSGGGQFSKDIASSSEADYVQTLHSKTIAAAERANNPDWATTMRASDARSVYNGALSLVQGAEQSWRDLLYKHPANKSFIFGENSIPNPDCEALPDAGIQVFVVPNAGHSMSLENPVGLAECLYKATRIKDSVSRNT